ncbi:MAG: hypothetical protein ACKOZW_03020 [Cyanobium sp.]
MSAGTLLLLALGIPLLVLVGATVWLSGSRQRLPEGLAWLAQRSGSIWVSGVVLITSVMVVRLLLKQGR